MNRRMAVLPTCRPRNVRSSGAAAWWGVSQEHAARRAGHLLVPPVERFGQLLLGELVHIASPRWHGRKAVQGDAVAHHAPADQRDAQVDQAAVDLGRVAVSGHRPDIWRGELGSLYDPFGLVGRAEVGQVAAEQYRVHRAGASENTLQGGQVAVQVGDAKESHGATMLSVIGVVDKSTSRHPASHPPSGVGLAEQSPEGDNECYRSGQSTQFCRPLSFM